MNRTAQASFFAWPGWAHIRFALVLMFLVTAWFCAVFAGTDWFTAHRIARVRIDLGFESHIPLIPAFTFVYMSIYLLFLAAPIVLRTRREITVLATAQLLAILVAGFFFLLIPAKLTFSPATDGELGWWRPLFRFADGLNLDYNLVPSLHVALSIVCIEMFCFRAGIAQKILLRSWGFLIAASTLFTHQHHLVDAVTGYLLAFGVVKFVCRLQTKTPATMERPAAVISETSPVA
jgi:uncharacterized membrane protein YozB (DUF420 family)